MSRTRGTGLIILALIGALDIAGTARFFTDNAPPAWVMLTGAALGLATLIGTGLAFAGRRRRSRHSRYYQGDLGGSRDWGLH